MSIQGVEGCCIDGKLALRWVTFAQANAISICIARNSEFTDTLRHFVVPVISSVTLDIGPGLWYVRLGTWSGSAISGILDWSNAYGPIPVVTSKPVVPTVPASLPILHKQAIQHGMRIFTGLVSSYYVLFERSTDPTFPASATKYSYALDNGRGNVDCLGMDFLYTYSLRISTMTPDRVKFPTDSVQQMSEGRVLHGLRCARPLRHADTGMTATLKSGNAILHDSKERPHMRFTSHRDYLRFQAAKAATGEEVKRV